MIVCAQITTQAQLIARASQIHLEWQKPKAKSRGRERIAMTPTDLNSKQADTGNSARHGSSIDAFLSDMVAGIARHHTLVRNLVLLLWLLVGGTFAAGYWYTERQQSFNDMKIIVAEELSVAQSRVERAPAGRASAIRRMAQRWVVQGGTPERLWYIDAQQYVDDYREIEALYWSDENDIVRYIVQRVPSLYVGDRVFLLDRNREAYETAIKTRTPYISSFFKYRSDPQKVGISVRYPLYINDQFKGFLGASINFNILFGNYLDDVMERGFYIDIHDDFETVNLETQPAEVPKTKYDQQTTISFGPREWTIRISPTAERIAALGNPGFDGILLGIITLSFVLALASWVSINLIVANNHLTAASAKAEMASRQKSRFLAAASHDLREPANAASLLLDTLALKVLSPDQKEILSHAQEALTYQKQSFDRILNLARLERGAIEPVKERVSLGALLERLQRSYDAVARSKGIELRVVPSSVIVETDPGLLERILSNFLSNALRHTLRGKVLIGCRRQGSSVSIQVHDTGQGVSSQKIHNIFQEFARGEEDVASAPATMHFGLGLYIVKQLSDLLGHKLDVHSVPKRGSCFCCVIPHAEFATFRTTQTVTALRQRPMETSHAAVASKTDIILIEDNEDTVRALTHAFTLLGLQAVSTASGHDALAKIAEGAWHPGFIVADYHLQDDMTGLEAVLAIRKRLGTYVPAVIVTGETSPDMLEQAAEAGLTVLHKPVRLEALLNEIRKTPAYRQASSAA